MNNAPITDYERDVMLPVIISQLKAHNGSPVKAKELHTHLALIGMPIQGPRLRVIIHHIRTNHLVRGLASGSNGYWIEKDPSKLMRSVDNLMGRVESIREAAHALASDVAHMRTHQV